ncbi:hypothetical protein LEP1GSC202_3493 [Leptospira yanagawae serovar Saopaulo str. Sao Paulo = ATCC 700523]|uniref:Uncharacterized protein n=1 Tax=Leptospira yanagawae serovar Saopaulo str. Sao Paulo = ATCC 700523 TaxID=1249483 RepID=A0A5E8HB55_9LEPT|nr:hypothetical protein LEP1GSC202_3493 [Leptospira yanagawae serovar Saopaulo str. Sao Paulo = ATCC 700523]
MGVAGERLPKKRLHGRGESLGGGSSSPPKSGGEYTIFLPNPNPKPNYSHAKENTPFIFYVPNGRMF